MTITDFLLARFSEDEADLCRCCDDGLDTRMGFARADLEAKRRIVDRITHTLTEGTYPDLSRRERSQGHRTLCDLALPYADHPDYREGWRL